MYMLRNHNNMKEGDIFPKCIVNAIFISKWHVPKRETVKKYDKRP